MQLMGKQTVHYLLNCIMKHFLQKVIFMCEKATVGIDLSSEMVKTGLHVTASSNVRLSMDVCT